jgi:myo-inositol-1(or 4)-monophosphatase
MADISILELEEFALELARTAGGIARAHFRRKYTVENKAESGFDPVTAADLAIERVLRAAIVDRYPTHGIVGEEEAARSAESPYTWYLDPIDGTRAFLTGSPLWGTLVGLTHAAKPLFGLMSQPILEEVFFGGTAGSWLVQSEQRSRLATSGCTSLGEAALASTHPGMFQGGDAAAFRALAQRCKLDRFGGDCYNYAMLAAGHVDLVVEARLKAFDIVPLLPVIEGAGGVVSDWEGRPVLEGGRVVAAATQALHTAALATLQNGAKT